MALNGHSVTAVESLLWGGKADIGQPLLISRDLCAHGRAATKHNYLPKAGIEYIGDLRFCGLEARSSNERHRHYRWRHLRAIARAQPKPEWPSCL